MIAKSWLWERLKPSASDSAGPVHQRIVSEFGRDVLNAEGIIDRDKLGKIVFADPGKRRKLDKAGQQSSFLLNPDHMDSLLNRWAGWDIEVFFVRHHSSPSIWKMLV